MSHDDDEIGYLGLQFGPLTINRYISGSRLDICDRLERIWKKFSMTNILNVHEVEVSRTKYQIRDLRMKNFFRQSFGILKPVLTKPQIKNMYN